MNDDRFNNIPIILETIDSEIWKQEIGYIQFNWWGIKNGFYDQKEVSEIIHKTSRKDKIDDIIRVALTAPTGRNSRATHFIVVDNKEDIKIITNQRHGSTICKYY